ncbi:MAG TPA: N-acetylglucosamine-6-phosphate deacetylase [Blastocatellia bacterium]|nr:N-acetylglucosamine-6-phosphate deacetylase [Blastocatellia bacterium]
MNQLLLHNARVALPAGVRQGGVLIREGRIAEIFAAGSTPTGFAAESIDLLGAYLAPGLIDIHIHGSAGVDVMEAGQDELAKLCEFLLSEGVTGFFPTLVPADGPAYEAALEQIGEHIRRQDRTGSGGQLRGARILGVHFEGPFVNQRRCGALNARRFRTYDGDPRSLDSLLNTARPPGDATSRSSSLARLMTLAPELDAGLELTRELSRRGVRPFIGHSQADPTTLDLAFQAGARHVTHFPNALDPLHHRKPGAVAWALVRLEVTLDCIADFHHVDPLMLRLIYQSKSADGMALISDAIPPAGLGDGGYSVWGESIVVIGGRTALTRDSGETTLAGSVMTLRQGLKNMVSVGVPAAEAFRMASFVPARAAAVEQECGSIEGGKCADLIAFGEDFDVLLGVVGGEVLLDRR